MDKLEGLLCDEKNRGIREAYFREEHLTQVRESHGRVPHIKAALEARDDDKRKEEADQQEQYCDQFLDAARKHYLQLSRPRVSHREQYDAARQSKEAAQAYSDSKKRLAYWEVMVRPGQIPAGPRIESLNDCRAIVQACQVNTNGWEYPHVRGDRQSGDDWFVMLYRPGPWADIWRLSLRGVFVHVLSAWVDQQAEMSMRKQFAGNPLPDGFIPRFFLDVEDIALVVTHVFRFAAGFAKATFDPRDEIVNIRITLAGARDRVLMYHPLRSRWALGGLYRATLPALKYSWSGKRHELRSAPDAKAAGAIHWFLERFNWTDMTLEKASRIQEKVLASR